MPKPTKTWRARERQIAAFFGTKRTPLSGGNSGHTRSDTLHSKFFVEAKYRKKQAVWTLFEATAELAKLEGKTPALALCQAQKQGFLVVVHSEHLEEFCKTFLEGRDVEEE